MRRFIRLATTIVAVVFSVSASAQTFSSLVVPHKVALGEVHFPTSCKRQVQSRFDQGVALLQSSEFKEAEQAFGQVEFADPQCVIADSLSVYDHEAQARTVLATNQHIFP